MAITCGNKNIDGTRHTHESVAGVRTCYSISQNWYAYHIPAAVGFTVYNGWVVTADTYASIEANEEAQAQAEYEAELRVERWYEERGGNAEPEPRYPF